MAENLFVVNNKLLQVENSEEFTLRETNVDIVPDDVPVVTEIPHSLRGQVIVLDSIMSGTGRSVGKSVYGKLLKPIFEILAIPHQYVATTLVSSVAEFAASLVASANSEITVIFISGDTSINEFVNGLQSTATPTRINIFPIPSGTGNSLALSLGLTDETKAIQKLFTSKDTAPLNLYEASFPRDSYFLVQDSKGDVINKPLKFLIVVSWAFHASLVADSDTPELREHGLERFKLAAFANLKQEQEYEGTMTINDRVFPGPFAYWLLTASKRFEPTFEILPQGNIFDDSLYLISFNTEDDPTGGYIMDIMGEVYNKGSHVHNPKVVYKRISHGDRITLSTKNSSSKRKRRFCLDGSIIALPEADESTIDIKAGDNRHKGWSLLILH